MFVELTRKNGQPVLVAVDRILNVSVQEGDPGGTYLNLIGLGEGDPTSPNVYALWVAETYKEVVAKLQGSTPTVELNVSAPGTSEAEPIKKKRGPGRPKKKRVA